MLLTTKVVQKKADSIVQEIEQEGGTAFAFKADVMVADNVHKFIEEVYKTLRPN